MGTLKKIRCLSLIPGDMGSSGLVLVHTLAFSLSISGNSNMQSELRNASQTALIKWENEICFNREVYVL